VTVNGSVEDGWDSVVITDSSGTQVNTQVDGDFSDTVFTADGTMTITITNDDSNVLGDLTFAVSCAAQTYSITFNVDPSSYAGYTEGESVVHLVGDFNGWNPGDENLQMSDDNEDGIHSITIELADGVYAYKFTLGNWDTQEFWNCEKECLEINSEGYWNRSLTVAGANEDLEFVHWNQCAGEEPAVSVTYTFEVCATNIEVGENGMYIGGGVTGGADAIPLSDEDGDGIWTGTFVATPNNIGGAFTILNSPNDGGDWGAKENIAGQDCAFGQHNDRLLPCVTEDTTVEVTYGDCSNESCVGLSTIDNQILEIMVYPNPVDGDFITIQSPVDGLKEIQVFTVTGRKVLDTTINGNTLDVSSFNSGFYMLKVTIDGQSKVSKLVVR